MPSPQTPLPERARGFENLQLFLAPLLPQEEKGLGDEAKRFVSQSTHQYITNTQELLSDVPTADQKLAEITHIKLSQSLSPEPFANTYGQDCLIPNFYFHILTAYDILHMTGELIEKRDAMLHLVPFIKRA
jgi:hypothetical protein